MEKVNVKLREGFRSFKRGSLIGIISYSIFSMFLILLFLNLFLHWEIFKGIKFSIPFLTSFFAFSSLQFLFYLSGANKLSSIDNKFKIGKKGTGMFFAGALIIAVGSFIFYCLSFPNLKISKFEGNLLIAFLSFGLALLITGSVFFTVFLIRLRSFNRDFVQAGYLFVHSVVTPLVLIGPIAWLFFSILMFRASKSVETSRFFKCHINNDKKFK